MTKLTKKLLTKTLKNSAIGLSAMLVSACATSDPRANVSADLETPDYKTVVKNGAFEVREYSPYIVAKTEVDADDWETASREGFRRIGGYIFGKNQQQQEVAMTAPVAVNAAQRGQSEEIAMTAPVGVALKDQRFEVTFMMPSEYSLETLPIPDDKRVKLEARDATCEAAVVFSGLTSEEIVEERAAGLRSWLAERQLTTEGGRQVFRYNDPLTLPWNRRNEVLFRLDADSCDAIGMTQG